MPAARPRSPSRSKSAAVRLAALYPSRRQLRKWNRERQVNHIVVATVVGVVLVTVSVLAFGYFSETVLRASETAATVNGERITMAQVLDRVRPRAAALDQQDRFYQAQGMTQAATQIRLQRSGLPDQVLDSIIEEKLVAAELNRRGLSVSESEVDEGARKEIAEQEAMKNPTPPPTAAPSPAADVSPSPSSTPGPTPTSTAVPTLETDAFDAAYQSFLKQANLTDAAFRELKRAEIARDRLRNDIGKNVPRTEEQAHARHILVDNDDSLKQVQDQLAQGVPFDQVAKDFSTDRATRDKGGDLGWFPRGQMNAPFEAAAFSQTIGDVGPPVQSPNGTHIIQVLERDPAHVLDPAQVEGKAASGYQAWYAGVRNGEGVKNDMTPEGRSWVLRQLGTRPRT
jgi:parvulin-like peptidyl-prolyl isomerase